MKLHNAELLTPIIDGQIGVLDQRQRIHQLQVSVESQDVLSYRLISIASYSIAEMSQFLFLNCECERECVGHNLESVCFVFRENETDKRSAVFQDLKTQDPRPLPVSSFQAHVRMRCPCPCCAHSCAL